MRFIYLHLTRDRFNGPDGPTFTVSRNDQFTGTVELQLVGDEDAPDPADNILPVQGNAAPAAGEMNEPVFNPDNFLFAANQLSRSVVMEDFSTNAVAPGIYTVWVMGESNVPYKGRRHPIAVHVGGATKGFHLANSSLSASAAAYGDTVTYTIRVRNDGWSTASPATTVELSWDPDSLSDCILNPITPPAGMTVGFSASCASDRITLMTTNRTIPARTRSPIRIAKRVTAAPPSNSRGTPSAARKAA